MKRPRPAVRIVFAPIVFRGRKQRQNFEKCMRLHGLADKAKRTILLDPRLSDVAMTLYHELTHIRHPSWTEDQVEAHEQMRWLRMSWREKARLYQMLGSARLEGEE